ncbi:MAG: hypothetical protein ABIR46_02705 [Candidatus Saccharimonadales bacterium]
MNKLSDQRGLVSFYTVILFALIFSVVAVGFTRIMLDEQGQTLEDDLSKSAYNSAIVGIEDAKRAMVYCNSVDTTQACRDDLYNQTCPGFNASFRFSGIGIPQNTGTVGDADLGQSYSCVTISPDTRNLEGRLTMGYTTDTAMYELMTVNNFAEIKLRWHAGINLFGLDGSTPNPFPSAASRGLTDGNPRRPDWNYLPSAPANSKYPTMLKITTIEAHVSGNIQIHDTSGLQRLVMNTTYMVPDNRTAANSVIDVTNSNVSPSKRTYASCQSGDVTGYECETTIKFSNGNGNSGPRYISIQALYADAYYQMTAHTNSGTLVNFRGVQPTIDSTGVAGSAYRRVQARVKFGTIPLNINSVLDTGGGVCKNFRVGVADYIFSELGPEYCPANADNLNSPSEPYVN